MTSFIGRFCPAGAQTAATEGSAVLCHDSAMRPTRLGSARLELTPLPAVAAAALPDDRETAAAVIGSRLPNAWPQSDLLDVLPMQAAAEPDDERFGVWLIIERDTNTVVGDIGFMGPPDGGAVEIGFSVIPDRRRRGYATEAARTLADWALRLPEVREVSARSEPENEASARVLVAAGFARIGAGGGVVRWRRIPG
jgi:RimJ/RimL family protein N-acetyltransferase